METTTEYADLFIQEFDLSVETKWPFIPLMRYKDGRGRILTSLEKRDPESTILESILFDQNPRPLERAIHFPTLSLSLL